MLRRHGFEVVERNARWQFEKQLDNGRAIAIDFHTPSPEGLRLDVRAEARRVKPQPALPGIGIHGRENPEAIGSELRPFTFASQAVTIAMPNPVTLAMMKMTAMRDRWVRGQDPARPRAERMVEEGEARKHTEDVCRVVAMVTRAEYDTAQEVASALQGSAAFMAARQVFGKYLATDTARAVHLVQSRWTDAQWKLIRNTLAAWFGL